MSSRLPHAFAIAPATFNTVNKLAAGISDTLALGLLNEAVGSNLPVIAVPFPNQMLARHPAFVASVAVLRSWGVRLIFDPARYRLPVPNQGSSRQRPVPVGRTPWTRVRTLEAERASEQPPKASLDGLQHAADTEGPF